MALITTPNIHDHDGFYQELIDLHRDMTAEQSRDLNCRMILIMANHIGDREVLDEIMKVASESGQS